MSNDLYQWNWNKKENKKKGRKSHEMYRGEKSDFERIRGEGILSMRYENQYKTRNN